MGDGPVLKDARSAFQSFFSAESYNPNSVQESQQQPQQSQQLKREAVANPINKIFSQIEKGKQRPDAAKEEKSKPTLEKNEAQTIIDNKERFNNILKDLEVKMSDLFSVIDSFLEKGYYEEHYRIKNFEFTFRTKKVQSLDRITDLLDGAKYTLESAAGQLLLEHNMAASLAYFKSGSRPASIFAHETNEDDEVSVKFIKALSVPIFAIMAQRLKKFEMLTNLATMDEAIERFLAHTQD
jgi:hypothetical protein